MAQNRTIHFRTKNVTACGNDSFFLKLTLVWVFFQPLQDCRHVRTSQWWAVHRQEDQQSHNVLLYSSLSSRGQNIMCCQRISGIHRSSPHPSPIILISAPRWWFLFLSFSLRFAFAHSCLPPTPITFCLRCPSPSCFLLLARCTARGSCQVQGPLPGPRHGCPLGPEQRNALSVASMGA